MPDIGKKAIARQSSNARSFSYSPRRTKPTETPIRRRDREHKELLEILGHDPADTPNHYETLPPSDPTQRDVRHLAVELLIQRDGDKCYLCKKPLTPRLTCIEHIIPLTSGGENTATNIALACYGCNSRKADRYVSLSVPSGAPLYHQPRT